MFWEPILLIIFTTAMIIQSWGFGNIVSNDNEFFKSNSFLRYGTGSIIYIAVSFLFFMPFMWIPNMHDVYWTIVFGSKEILTLLYLIGNRDKLPKKINLSKIIFVFGTTILILCLERFVWGIFQDWKSPEFGNFQSWHHMDTLLGIITGLSEGSINRWGLGMYSSLLFVTTIFGIVQSLSRKNNIWDLVYASIITLTIAFISNNEYLMAHRLHHSAVLLSMVYSANTISKSRRRYSVMTGMAFMAAWSLHDNVIFTFIAIGIVTSVLYTFINRQTPTSFMINMFTPIIMVSTLYIYNHSLWAALSILIVTAIVYAYTTINAELNIVVWAGAIITLLGRIFPFVLGLALFISGLIINQDKIGVEDPSMIGSIIHMGANNKIIEWVNISLFILAMLFGTLFLLKNYLISKRDTKKSVNEKNIFLPLAITTLFLFYNPINYNVFKGTLIDGYMDSLKYFVTVPMLIFATNHMKEKIKTHTVLYKTE